MTRYFFRLISDGLNNPLTYNTVRNLAHIRFEEAILCFQEGNQFGRDMNFRLGAITEFDGSINRHLILKGSLKRKYRRETSVLVHRDMHR